MDNLCKKNNQRAEMEKTERNKASNNHGTQGKNDNLRRCVKMKIGMRSVGRCVKMS